MSVGTVIGIDPAARDRGEAEHVGLHLLDVLDRTGAGAVILATHIARPRGVPARDALSLSILDGAAPDGPGPQDLVGAVAEYLADLPGAAAAATWPGSADGWSIGPQDRLPGAWAALMAAVTRQEGRLVRYPGEEGLRGRLPVAGVSASGVVDEVRVLGGTPVPVGAVLDTRDFVRPVWGAGRTVLLVQPGAGCLVPFEKENPESCCQDHIGDRHPLPARAEG